MEAEGYKRFTTTLIPSENLNETVTLSPEQTVTINVDMKPKNVENNIKQLNKIASRIITEMDVCEEEDENLKDSDENTVDEIKRLIPNLLSSTKMSTPELRRYFKLSNSQIWKIMSDLENAKKIKRAEKKGRSILWTAI